MKKQPVQVTCCFSGEGDVRQILMQLFCRFLDRNLTERYGKTV